MLPSLDTIVTRPEAFASRSVGGVRNPFLAGLVAPHAPTKLRSGDSEHSWGLPKIRGTIWGPNNKDSSTWGSILASPYFGKLPVKAHTSKERRGCKFTACAKSCQDTRVYWIGRPRPPSVSIMPAGIIMLPA